MTNLIYKAIKFAEDKHQGQVRKVSNEPYVTHPLAVSYIVSSFKKSKHLDEILVACLLHDTLEDTETNFVEIATEFSPLVASLVLELTSDEAEIARVGKTEYLKKKLVGISNYALIIKLADRLHNLSDTPKEKTLVETREIIEYLKKNRKLTATQKAMAIEIEKLI